MPHQVLVGVAQDVVVIGAVLRKIECRAGEDVDQVRQPLHHLVPLAELVRVVEIGEVAMRQTRVGLHKRGDDLHIDSVADVTRAA